MKTLQCDICEATTEGETFEEWMKALMPHYQKAHSEFMKAQAGKSQQEQKEEQSKWMQANKKRFDNA